MNQSDDPPVSQPPRSRQASEPFLRGPAEEFLEDTRDRFLVSVPPPKMARRFPRWAKAGAIIAFVLSVVRWLVGVR